MTRPGDDAGKAMGKIEETLGELRDDVATAKARPTNTFKPLWLLAAVIVAVIVGVVVFVGVGRVAGTSKSIVANCKQRNEQFAVVNEKFGQLNTLIEVITETVRPGGVLDQPEVRDAFETLRQPIPPVKCRA